MTLSLGCWSQVALACKAPAGCTLGKRLAEIVQALLADRLQCICLATILPVDSFVSKSESEIAMLRKALQ